MDKRRAKKGTALLSRNGYIRISSDLLPSDARKKPLYFSIVVAVKKRALGLRMVRNKKGSHLALRKAMWPNDAARSPLVAIRSALKFIGVPLPRKKSAEYAVKKEGNLLKIAF